MQQLAVIGLGFVGLPLSLSYAQKGVRVVGVDVLPQLVHDLNRGVSRHQERDGDKTLPEILKEMIEKGLFQATTDYTLLQERKIDTYIITVGLPVRQGVVDQTPLLRVAEQLGTVLKRGDFVLVRSTVVPGTTEEIFLPALERVSGLKASRDFDLAYSSERIAEGRAFEEFRTMPLAVGGIDEKSLNRAIDVLKIVTDAPIYPASIKVVETAKVIENIQRDVNLAMVQEFARFTERYGLDTLEVMRIANTHKRVQLLTPGPGIGGYCVPYAYYYLKPKAEEIGLRLPLLSLARELNDGVPHALVSWVEETLKAQGKSFSDARVAVLGLAMKDYTNDDRESPPLVIAELLVSKGARVLAYDPIVARRYPFSVDSLEEAVDDADVLFFLVRQKPFDTLDWRDIGRRLKPDAVVFDARGVIPKDALAQTLLRI
ncbi:MAG: UDP-glucose dehydrogenase [Candidatus Carbobacillus altaicus]|uniref:UDP-glucose dehydrogenase n=1 Tax=Candidatus Carbonibacillus altaicus TaxID=2163959 RepID=A0A2R6Y4J2_9BACL|nr:MAG: UDP-glucose dehydrogenase [Candidatus Carbobacillus altaicus]